MSRYNKIPLCDRRRIYNAYKDEKDWKAVAATLGINKRTAYHWLQKEQELPKPKGGSTSKKTPEIIEVLKQRIEENVSTTLAELSDLIWTRFELRVSKNTIKNWLDAELFSVKKVRPVMQNMNSEINKTKRREYLETLLDARSTGRTLIWTDETNFNLYCKRSEGRSRIGQRASVLLPSSKGANLHCIGAMTCSKVVLFTVRRGSYNAEDCKQWFQQLIEECHLQGLQNPTFIVDNAPAHSRLEDLLDENPHVQILRLAPYSYLLNPIELLWSSFKSHVKRQLRHRMLALMNVERHPIHGSMTEQRMQALEEIANSAITQATPANLLSYVNRVERYYAMAVREEDLVELP